MKRILIFTCLVFLIIKFATSQDLEYVRKTIDTLSSKKFYGRGYALKGDSIAADYIKNEFKNIGLKGINNNYYQYFNFKINTFITSDIKYGRKKLLLGDNYLPVISSNGLKGKYKTYYINKNNIYDKKYIKKIKEKYQNRIGIFDSRGIKDDKLKDEFENIVYYNEWDSKGYFYIKDKNLQWSVHNGYPLLEHTLIDLDNDFVYKKRKKIKIDLQNDFKSNYQTQNIFGFVEGKQFPDSFIVISAHYDHLGGIGDNYYFAGANDNASGVSMILDLAKHIAKLNDSKYSILFIAFAAEEMGLLGSKYFVGHSPVDLKKIKFVINFDMLGTGEEGIKVVNSTVYEKQFEILTNINESNNYIPNIYKRGEAANSDHYYFHKAGIPSFYIYTLGGSAEYHNAKDTPEKLSLHTYNNLFKLLLDFIHKL